ALFGIPAAAAAKGDTGFLRGEGHSDVALSFTRDSYDHFWVGDDRVEDPAVGEVTRDSYNLYAAYGMSHDTDLVLNAAYVTSESDGTGGFDDESDLQDLVV